MSLDQQEITRYSRHLVLEEVGMEGQEKLKASSALVVGAGGLGSPVTMYLAAAGIGRLGLVDFDQIDFSNLQRQILYGTSDVGKLKLDVAADRLEELNPHVVVERHPLRLSSENALEILAGYDVILDGTDNFATRYLINDACVLLGKPNVYGSILRFEGQASVFWAEKGPCYRCLFPDPPPAGAVPSCAEGGVLGVLPGIIGSIQAMEAIKLLLGQGDSLLGRLLAFDALEMSFRQLKLRKDPNCPVCGENPTITELLDYDAICGLPGESTAELSNGDSIANSEGDPFHTTPINMDVQELKSRIDAGNAPVLIDVREAMELQICQLPGNTHIPMNQMPDRMGELDSEAEVVVYCKTGVRSAMVVEYMRANGHGKAINLLGGIEAWSVEIDSSVARY